MGYTAIPHTDSDAASAYNQLPNDNLFCFIGHGSPGSIKFHDLIYITAHSPNPVFKNLSNYNNDELDDLVLAAYIGCDTGKTGDTDGNLLDESVSRGVDTALGFNSEILSGRSKAWSNKFCVVSRINFTHITIFLHNPKSSPEAICTRIRYMAHPSQGSCEA